MSYIAALQVTPDKAGPALSPAQKRFNTLIRQIEQARQTLAMWHEHIALYRQEYARVLLPLHAELLAGHRQWVFAVDAVLDQPNWTKAERGTLRELLCDAAGELLAARGDDAGLKAVFDKHAESDFDTEQREAALAMKELAQAMTGLDLGDDEGIETEADLFKRMRRSVEEQRAAEESERSAKSARRRKSAAQQRREDEAAQATQSVREIYRKLASALHPDRETDEHQRELKTALMQQVNQSYAANDLLGLLELQLRIEQIDASHIANASEQRLKHYNKVLNEQLAELKAATDQVEFEFRVEFNLEPGWRTNPRKLGETLRHTGREWRAALLEIQHQVRMFGDAAATKRWLKRQRQLLREAERNFVPF